MRNIIVALLLSVAITPELSAQIVDNDYQFLVSLETGLDRKMYANEVMLDDNQEYLVVNYGNKPTYIVVFEYGSWEAKVNFRLPNWVEFSGAYIDYNTKHLYIKASRYSSEYYRLDLETGKQEMRECETLPAGCPVVEPKQADKGIYSNDEFYYVAINKKNARDVRIYQKR